MGKEFKNEVLVIRDLGMDGDIKKIILTNLDITRAEFIRIDVKDGDFTKKDGYFCKHLDARFYGIQQFWNGFTCATIMWLCLIVLVLAVNVTYIKDVIIYAGQVSALQGEVKELPMMKNNK